VFNRKAEDGLKDAKIKIPTDFAIIIDDIKVCGRGDLQKLLTMRHKFQTYTKNLNRPVKEEAPEVDPQVQIERDLEEAVKRMEKEKKRAAKKERELKQKSELRQKMSVIATSTGIDNDEELHMSQRLWEDVRA
jgi:hypothetical protein